MLVDDRTFERKTRRLILRPLRPSDYAAWARAHAEMLPSQSRFDAGPRPREQLTRSKFRELLAARRSAWARDRFYMLSVFHRRTGDLIGLVNVITHVRSLIQTAAIGYVVHNPHWRKGYASEAIVPVVKLAFETLRFHRLTAEVATDNRASIATIEKAGFRKEARAKRFVYDGGKWRDAYIYALTAEERGIERMEPEVRIHFSEA